MRTVLADSGDLQSVSQAVAFAVVRHNKEAGTADYWEFGTTTGWVKSFNLKCLTATKESASQVTGSLPTGGTEGFDYETVPIRFSHPED